jgi:hypothetical protein
MPTVWSILVTAPSRGNFRIVTPRRRTWTALPTESHDNAWQYRPGKMPQK